MANKKMIATLMLIGLVAMTGCSDDNPVTPTAVVDTAPPAAPQNIDLAFDGSAATISWDANTVDSDLVGYIVVRERYGVSETLVGTPTVMNSFQDAAPLTGSSQYHVFAVDEAGNESAVATAYLTVSLSKPFDSERNR